MIKYLLLPISFLTYALFLNAQPPGTVTVTSVTNAYYCDAKPTGAIDLTVQGGYTPYTYLWNSSTGFSSDTEDISNLKEGTYCVTVTDKFCGEASLCVVVGCEKSCPKIDLKDLDAAIQHPSICDANDGNIYFRFGGPIGGASPYEMTVYDEEGNLVSRTGQSWSGLSVGEYTILVEDANGCKGEFEAILLPEDGGVYLTSEFLPTCEGQMNGSVSVLAYSINQGSGNNEFIYTWSTGQVFQTNDIVELSGLEAGLYCVTVTSTDQENKACTAEKCFTIENVSEESPLRILFENYTEYLCPENEGSGYIDFTVTGGVPNIYETGAGEYTYNWNGTGGGGPFMAGLGAGIHTVVITDYCGNEISASYEIILFDPLSIFSEVENTCPKRSQGSIFIEVADPDRELFFEWSNGETSNPLINLEEGFYSVTITDQNGCQLFDDFEIVNFDTYEEPIEGTCDNNVYCSGTGEFLYTQMNEYNSIVFDKDCRVTVFCLNGEVINEEGVERLEDVGACMFKKYCQLDIDELGIHVDEFIETTEGTITMSEEVQ